MREMPVLKFKTPQHMVKFEERLIDRLHYTLSSLQKYLKEQQGILRPGQVKHYTDVLLLTQARDLNRLLNEVAKDRSVELSSNWLSLIYLIFKEIHPEHCIAKYIIYVCFYVKALLINRPIDESIDFQVDNFLLRHPSYEQIRIFNDYENIIHACSAETRKRLCTI
jgi:hypothetical protein